jgi:hypothetical protein
LPPLFLALVLLGANIIEKRGRKKERGGGLGLLMVGLSFFLYFFLIPILRYPSLI